MGHLCPKCVHAWHFHQVNSFHVFQYSHTLNQPATPSPGGHPQMELLDPSQAHGSFHCGLELFSDHREGIATAERELNETENGITHCANVHKTIQLTHCLSKGCFHGGHSFMTLCLCCLVTQPGAVRGCPLLHSAVLQNTCYYDNRRLEEVAPSLARAAGVGAHGVDQNHSRSEFCLLASILTRLWCQVVVFLFFGLLLAPHGGLK